MSMPLKLLPLSVVLFISCSSSDNSGKEEIPEGLNSNDAAERIQPPIPALVITCSVQTVQQWKKVFDEERKRREKLDILDLGNLTSYDNPREISSFLKTPSHEKGKEFIESEELKEEFSEMGVVGEPKILYMDIIKMPEKTFPQRYRMMITHEVKDYDHWKEVFDQHEPERRLAGLELVGIGRSHSDPLEISVMFAFDDMDAAKLFASSDELKQAMEESGVVSDPVLSWYQSFTTN